MTAAALMERLSIVSPLGVRFRDEATLEIVTAGLAVDAYPASRKEMRTGATLNGDGVFVFHNLPGLREVESGSGDDAFWDAQTPRFDFVLEVRDFLGRYLPYALPVKLPQRGIFSVTGLGEESLPLYSAPARAVPDAMGVLRATLVDSGDVASWALVTATVAEQRAMTGMTDGRGQLTLPLRYPKRVLTLGSPSMHPLGDQSWPVDLTVRYARRASVPEVPDLSEVLNQPVAAVQQPAVTLQFGRELVLRAFQITPAGSPP